MIISANIIKNPRTKRRCESCRKNIEGPQVRLYGSAHEGEPPYIIFECMGCAKESHEEKVVAALEAES